MILVENAYHLSAEKKLPRYLVDRVWPHGVHRRALDLDGWVRAAAPSDALRLWFRHEPARFGEFCARYRRELERQPASWRALAEAAKNGGVTLVYGTMHPRFSDALILKAFLEEQIKSGAGARASRVHLLKKASRPGSPALSKRLSRKNAKPKAARPAVNKEKRLRFVF